MSVSFRLLTARLLTAAVLTLGLCVAATADEVALPPRALDFNLNNLGGNSGSGPGGGGFDSFQLNGTPFGRTSAKPQLSMAFTPATAGPGQTVTLSITLTVPEGGHTFSQRTERDGKPLFGGATAIAVPVPTPLVSLGDAWQPDRPPTLKSLGRIGQAEEYEGTVTWSRRLRIDPDFESTAPADVTADGSIDFQVCDQQCTPYERDVTALLTVDPALRVDAGDEDAAVVAFGSEADLGSGIDASETPFGETPFGEEAFGEEAFGSVVDAADASDLAAATSPVDGDYSAVLGEEFVVEKKPLLTLLGLAFLGGLILNVMPCVLPVLQIKAMSLSELSGEDRGRTIALGVAYTFGVLAVMAALAAGMILFKQAWGTQFGNPKFVLPVAAVVFALALSLLGVYELPLPGFVGRADAAAKKEGLVGAFVSGIFATLLATPCTGPFLGGVTGALLSQPTAAIVLLMLTIGFGLAFPYLLVSIFPRLVSWLPRPGIWMVKFKQLTGFVMLGVVLWLLHPLPDTLYEPALLLFLAIGLGLWMLDQFAGPEHAAARRWMMRSVSAAVVLLGGWASWQLLPATIQTPGGVIATEPVEVDRSAVQSQMASTERPVNPAADADLLEASSNLNWEPFTEDRLGRYLSEGRTVLIDFTADWCLNCKLNEANALNTAATKRQVTENNIPTLVADFTQQPPMIRKWLNKYGYDSVPLTVIIPQGRLAQTKVLDGIYSQSRLLNTLENAVATEPAGTIQAAAR